MSAAEPPAGAGVLYDVTRLIARRKAAAPTGIDRVDLRYALQAARLEWGPAMFVSQLGGTLVEVPRSVARRLLSDLADRWLEGGRGADIEPALREAGLVGAAPPESRVAAGAKAARTFALTHHRAIYLNTSHHGLSSREMLAGLHGRLGGGSAFFVHDLIPIEFPEHVRPNDRAQHEARMATVLSLGTAIIVNSDATRLSLEAWAARNGYRPPAVQVARIGVEPGFLGERPAAPPPIDHPYFVCVNTIEPRKNHITLLHLWRAMARELPADQVPKLVLIGRRGWECEHVFAMLDRCEVLKPHVIELSALDDARMRAWLLGARAALFPSFTEGWGMPVVEALALGVPVICSDIPVFRDASQGLGDAVDPLDAPGWRRRIMAHAAEPPEQRNARRAALRAFLPPSWDEHFGAVRAALFGAMRRGSGGGTAPARPACRLPAGIDLSALAADPELDGFSSAVQAGDSARDRKAWTAAARAYRRALELRPDASGIWIQYGHMAKEAGHLQAAYDAYCEAMRLTPADADLHLQLGHLFKRADCLPQAAAYYEAALSLDSGNAEARRHLDWARRSRGAMEVA